MTQEERRLSRRNSRSFPIISSCWPLFPVSFGLEEQEWCTWVSVSLFHPGPAHHL